MVLQVHVSPYDAETDWKVEFNAQQYQIKLIFSVIQVLFLLQQVKT